MAPAKAADVQAAMKAAYAKYKDLGEGKNADYIPALAKVDSKLFGIAVVSVDGTVYEIGDSKHAFAIESAAKPFIVGQVMQEMGTKAVEEKIGVNATGMPFNSIIALEMNKETTPAMNPLVNAGAMTSVSLLQASSPEQRWQKVLGTLSAFSGRGLTLNEEIYRSEAETNTRNKSIAWLLKANNVLQGEPDEMLDVYTKECSVDVTARDLAVMGATLANGGLNPLTRKRVVEPDVAEHVLAVMSTAGLYDTTGTWMYRVGMPAKSGVGGGIVAVQPGKFAIATFSPPLDKPGNSVRGQRAIEMMADDLHAGVFNVPKGK
jgi:glutaminase